MRALVLTAPGECSVLQVPLSASPGLAAAIRAYALGEVDPRPLVAATVSLDQAGAVLPGRRPETAGPGPKIHIDHP